MEKWIVLLFLSVVSSQSFLHDKQLNIHVSRHRTLMFLSFCIGRHSWHANKAVEEWNKFWGEEESDGSVFIAILNHNKHLNALDIQITTVFRKVKTGSGRRQGMSGTNYADKWLTQTR